MRIGSAGIISRLLVIRDQSGNIGALRRNGGYAAK
jgi:hypothetical protein